jgi:regulator of cell morphogenesis and NO signaling
MAKEERILYPAMRAGGGAGLTHPVAVMRADHDDHAENIALIRQLARDLTPPFLEELAAHFALENDMLFPRFEQAR